MKFHWKLFLGFYLPLHFAFGSFYLSETLKPLVIQETKSESGFSFEIHCQYIQEEFSSSDLFAIAGLGLILLSVLLPSLILYRNYQSEMTKPTKLFD